MFFFPFPAGHFQQPAGGWRRAVYFRDATGLALRPLFTKNIFHPSPHIGGTGRLHRRVAHRFSCGGNGEMGAQMDEGSMRNDMAEFDVKRVRNVKKRDFKASAGLKAKI